MRNILEEMRAIAVEKHAQDVILLEVLRNACSWAPSTHRVKKYHVMLLSAHN